MSIREDLKAYLDGELDSIRREEIAVALNSDPELRAEFAQLRILSESITSYATEIQPHGLDDTLRALRNRETQSRRIATPWAWGAGFAAAAVVIGFMLLPHSAADSADADASRKSLVASASKAANAPVAMSDIAGSHVGGDVAKMKGTPAPHANLRVAKALRPRPSGGVSLLTTSGKAINVLKPTPIRPSIVANKSHKAFSGESSVIAAKVAPTLGTVTLSKDRPMPVAMLAKDHTTVALKFESVSEGISQVLAIVGKSAVLDSAKEEAGASGAHSGETTITVELPVETADKVVQQLRSLSDPSIVAFKTPARATFGGGGPGGGLSDNRGLAARSKRQNTDSGSFGDSRPSRTVGGQEEKVKSKSIKPRQKEIERFAATAAPSVGANASTSKAQVPNVPLAMSNGVGGGRGFFRATGEAATKMRRIKIIISVKPKG